MKIFFPFKSTYILPDTFIKCVVIIVFENVLIRQNLWEIF